MNITNNVKNFTNRYGLCPFCNGSGAQAYMNDVINCMFCNGEGVVFREKVPDVFDFMKNYFRKYKHHMTRKQMTKNLGIAYQTFYQATKNLYLYQTKNLNQ